MNERELHELFAFLLALELPVSIVDRVTTLKDKGVLNQQAVSDITAICTPYAIKKKQEFLAFVAELMG